MIKSKLETYLGFCVRSRKIIFGVEMISRQKKGVKLLLCDDGMGASSLKIIKNAQTALRCPLWMVESGVLGEILHRPAVKVVAITDEHLSAAILSVVAEKPQFKLYSGGNN